MIAVTTLSIGARRAAPAALVPMRRSRLFPEALCTSPRARMAGTTVAHQSGGLVPDLGVNPMVRRLIIAAAMLLGGIETLSVLTLICRS